MKASVFGKWLDDLGFKGKLDENELDTIRNHSILNDNVEVKVDD